LVQGQSKLANSGFQAPKHLVMRLISPGPIVESRLGLKEGTGGNKGNGENPLMCLFEEFCREPS
jgi:hypothetical protein